MAIKFVTFTDGACSSGPKVYRMPGGLANSGVGKKIFNNAPANSIELYLNDGWDTDFVSYYKISVSTAFTAGAAFGMTIEAMNGLGVRVTTKDASLNSETFCDATKT